MFFFFNVRINVYFSLYHYIFYQNIYVKKLIKIIVTKKECHNQTFQIFSTLQLVSMERAQRYN